MLFVTDKILPLGMTVAIDMIRQGNGRNFMILEKGHRVGGTWSDNEYPGACCDGMIQM